MNLGLNQLFSISFFPCSPLHIKKIKNLSLLMNFNISQIWWKMKSLFSTVQEIPISSSSLTHTRLFLICNVTLQHYMMLRTARREDLPASYKSSTLADLRLPVLKCEATGKTLTLSALITPEPLVLSFSLSAEPFFPHSGRMCVMRLGASVTAWHAAQPR